MTAMIEKLVTDLHPPLSRHESSVEADRCYFCYDAPCMTACPTGIEVPLFIRQISTGNAKGAAKTIFNENILGGMCARDCPTETLCEQACVRNTAEDQPVRIGELQRYATDHLMASAMSTGTHPYTRAAQSTKRIAVVGAGPAGLACAHRLARYGHEVTILEAREKAGGLNEYGIAAYKTVDNFAQRELAFVLSIGGISIQTGIRLGTEVTLTQLCEDFDAVFLGIGLDDVNALGVEGEDLQGVEDAVSFIATLRQSTNPSNLAMKGKVVVLGGGMTAIDAAMQSRLLGASEVTVVYRRGVEQMNASPYEQQLAQTHGITIKPWLQPKHISGAEGSVVSIDCEVTSEVNGKLSATGEIITLAADRVFKAIGQSFDETPVSGNKLTLLKGRLQTDAEGRTANPKVWAGGDCISASEDLTVAAVQDGKIAAQSIHLVLSR